MIGSWKELSLFDRRKPEDFTYVGLIAPEVIMILFDWLDFELGVPKLFCFLLQIQSASPLAHT